MDFEALHNLILSEFGEQTIVTADKEALQPSITIEAERLVAVTVFLRDNEQTYFDMLSCVSGIDNGPEEGTMEVVYHLYSIPYGAKLTLKVVIKRNQDADVLPQVPSLSSVWKSADWMERETFDLLGINFENHPDLRRILLPADWEGYPLRKDYQAQEYYHGIKVAYE
ncbi:NADH-quinone oxidoreductase subunit C [Limibacter armeniacum]|uniref:NADH-quinone oxidoreductase subunit C n=1 Tax=Limibacter armeniacum TaxID=466084 RepID=UPI002FE66BA2